MNAPLSVCILETFAALASHNTYTQCMTKGTKPSWVQFDKFTKLNSRLSGTSVIIIPCFLPHPSLPLFYTMHNVAIVVVVVAVNYWPRLVVRLIEFVNTLLSTITCIFTHFFTHFSLFILIYYMHMYVCVCVSALHFVYISRCQSA